MSWAPLNLILQAGERLGSRVAGKSRAIGYIGWLGANNLGDDALRESIEALVGEDNFIRYWGARRESFLASIGLGGPAIFRHILLGGGTLINPGYLKLVMSALDAGVRCSSFGTGVGSPGISSDSEVPLNGWAEVLSRFDSVTVRGPLSKRRLERIGVLDVRVIGDAALSLPLRGLSRGPEKRRRILLNFCREPSVDVVCDLGGVLRELASDGYLITPIALSPDDVEPITAAMCRLGLHARTVQTFSVKSLAIQLEDAALCIGERLHACVLACAAEVPFVSIAYRDKCVDFAESVGVPDQAVSVDPYKTGSFPAAVQRALLAGAEWRSAWAISAEFREMQAIEARKLAGLYPSPVV